MGPDTGSRLNRIIYVIDYENMEARTAFLAQGQSEEWERLLQERHDGGFYVLNAMEHYYYRDID